MFPYQNPFIDEHAYKTWRISPHATTHVHVPCDSRARGLCTSYVIARGLCTSCVVFIHVAYVIPVRFSYTQDIPPDDSSVCLGINIVEISSMEARVLSFKYKEKTKRHENSNP